MGFITDRFRWFGGSGNRNGLASARQINEAFLRERMRIDRRGGSVCLLTFELTKQSPEQQLDRLSRVMQTRLRHTDLAGLLEPCRVAVVLPDTRKLGAEKLASDIRLAAGSLTTLSHDITEYAGPLEARQNGRSARARNSDENGHGTGSASDELTVVEQPADEQAVEAVFCLPVPLWKRATDLVGAVVGIILFTPLVLIAAALIRVTSPGPVFFVQRRAGRGGKVFPMLKLRTMYNGAEHHQHKLRPMSEQDGPAFKMKDDPRLTSVGRFLRKTSIDELPQFINVLKGEMSLVGPRPLPYAESAKCEGWQRRRLNVNPGMTCIWQVHARSSVPFVEWIRMDLQYVRQMSFALDLKLILQTFQVVLRQKSAH